MLEALNILEGYKLKEMGRNRAPYLHAYELGDLDPREAAHTAWIAREPVDAVVLIYRGLAVPTLIALADGDPAALHRLLAEAAAAFTEAESGGSIKVLLKP